MKSIEKSLTNFLNGTAPRVSEEQLVEYASRSKEKANEIIDILFNVINYSLDIYTGSKTLEKERDLLKCVSTVMLNNSDVDRGIVARKIHKLDYKLANLSEANKKRIIDFDMVNKEIEKTRLTVDALNVQTITTETKSYDFINHLVTTIKDISYIECVFSKAPHLINAKDKEEICLFHNIVIKYMSSAAQGNEEDALYYSNLLSLMITNKNFMLSDKDKRKCLETIYTEMGKMSCTKKKKKQNIIQLDVLHNLVDSIKGEEKQVDIGDLSKKYNISISFNPEILNQVSSVKTKTGTMTDREVVDDYTITIDKEGAIEIDDALTCRKLPNGNYLLGVHIASVLGYFPWESEVIQEAISRNRSIYLPVKYQDIENDYDRIIPIFPYEFSAKTASLIPGESKLARSYFFEIDKKGNIIREEFVKTIVKSDMKTTYEQIDEVLRKGSKNKELERLVNCLQEVTEIIDKKYQVSTLYEQIKTSADDFTDLPVKSIGSQKIINKIMLLTGNRVANFFAENSYPCLYRVHEVNESNIIKLQAMIDNLNRSYGGEQFEQLFKVVSGLYPKGWYDICGSHYGLGLEHYCHCTSGLRRAADIVIEHALEVCYDKEPTDEEILELQYEIGVLASRINSKQAPIDWFIKDYKRIYQKRRH